MRLRLVLLAALVVIAPGSTGSARAQETQPGDACAAGDIHRARQVAGPENPGTGYLLVCDGSTWKIVDQWDTATGNSLFQVDYDSAACDALKEGRLRYSSTGDLWEYCHNDAWTALASASAIDDLSDAATYYTSGNMFLGAGAGAAIQSGGLYNVTLGPDTGAAITSGADNTAMGYRALFSNSTGNGNTAIGRGALYTNNGGNNTAIGLYALLNNNSGNDNTVIGRSALYTNSGGHESTVIGSFALTLATGGPNTVIGYRAGDSITTGTNNILIGHDVDAPANNTSNYLNLGDIFFGSGVGTTAGSQVSAVNYCDENFMNCFTAADVDGGGTPAGGDREIQFNSNGVFAAYANFSFTSARRLILHSDGAAIENTIISGGNETMTAGYNTLVGFNAGADLTSGGANAMFGNNAGSSTTTGEHNSFFGHSAGQNNQTGSRNMFIGETAGYSQVSGDENIYIGAAAGYNQDGGGGNVAIGTYAGWTLTSGNDNILIRGDVPAANASSYLNIGNAIKGDMATGNIEIAGTAALKVPTGTTAERPAAAVGMIRYCTSGASCPGGASGFEGYTGSWTALGGGGGGGTPAGADTQIQFNSGGAFGASANLVWDNANARLGIGTNAPAYNMHVRESTSDTDTYMQIGPSAGSTGANAWLLLTGHNAGVPYNAYMYADWGGGLHIRPSSFANYTKIENGSGIQVIHIKDKAVAIGSNISPPGGLVVEPATTQAIVAGGTIAADACGTIKKITAASAVTTNTVNTFTAPAAANAGCCMDVVNVGTTNTITLDNNAKFKSNGGSDQALSSSDGIRVCSDGATWYQISPVSAN